MGFLEISDVTPAVSGVFRSRLVGIKSPSMTLLMKYFSPCNLTYIIPSLAYFA